jgi:uncharacterized protein
MSAAPVVEEVVNFACARSRLWGIVSRPTLASVAKDTAVVIVVGGPQYRVGSHRQFVLLARGLATAGYPVLRFDYTGMGDSDGELRTFESSGPDLKAALDAMSRACPTVRRIVVWGLCDAASAAMMFASEDPRVAGIVVANPWARSEATLAVARLKYYYVARLLQGEFWRKLLKGGLSWGDSWRSLIGSLNGVRSRGPSAAPGKAGAPFQVSMAHGLKRIRGPVLLILSGNDLTAKEFIEYADSSDAWRGVLRDPKIQRLDLHEADHTFSQRRWLDQVVADTIAWLGRLDPSPSSQAVITKTTSRGNR